MAKLTPRAQAYLQEKHFGKLATILRDGSPHVTPIWYMLDRGKVIVNTSKDRVKYYNIKRDSRVCLLVDDGYTYLILFGRARIATERDAKKDIESLAVRYQGEAKGRRAARGIYWKMPRISLEIIPDRVVSGL
jgi:PPOX class probable F420-dependent enzyme